MYSLYGVDQSRMQDSWKLFIKEIEKNISKQELETWFKPLKPVEFSKKSVCFGVPKKFFEDWLKENYKALIEKSVQEIFNTLPDIRFSVVTYPVDERKREEKNTVQENIDTNYTFNNFVVGPSNQLAHAACMAVAANPGKTYNPLFIYSGSGLGKTHLLHSIYHQCLKKNASLNVLYIQSESFTNELISSIRYQKMPSFRKKYRNIDVLLLDDIQFIAGKERTEEEFFHTFNSLFEIKKQIVVTSDKTPREIDNLEDRIRSRFEWGLIADIQPPDIETKVAIIQKKAASQNIRIANDVAFLLAENVKSNIRELEGFITRISAFSSLYGSDITVDFTKEILKDIIKFKEKEISPDVVIKEISKFFNIKLSDLKSKKKNASIVVPRQISMYILRHKTRLSFSEIGQFFGGKDHSTVIHAIKKVDYLLKEDENIKNSVDNILKKL